MAGEAIQLLLFELQRGELASDLSLHFGHGAGQGAELVVTRHGQGQRGIVRALAEFAQGAQQLVQGLGQPARQQGCQHDGQGTEGQHDAQAGAAQLVGIGQHGSQRLAQADHEAFVVVQADQGLAHEGGDQGLLGRVGGLEGDQLLGAVRHVITDQLAGIRKSVLHQRALAAVKGEGLLRVGVDEEVALAVAQVQAQGVRQVGCELLEQSGQVDVDHDQPQRLLLRVVHGRGHLQRGAVPACMRTHFVVDAGTGHVHRACRQSQRFHHVGIVALFLQILFEDAEQAFIAAVHAHALGAVVGGRDEPHLKILGVGVQDGVKQRRHGAAAAVGGLALPGLQQSQCAGVLGHHQHVAAGVVQTHAELACQHAGGGQQALFGGRLQQRPAFGETVVARQARGQHPDQSQGNARAPDDAQLHGAITLLSLAPEWMRAHSCSRREAFSTGCSQMRLPLLAS